MPHFLYFLKKASFRTALHPFLICTVLISNPAFSDLSLTAAKPKSQNSLQLLLKQIIKQEPVFLKMAQQNYLTITIHDLQAQESASYNPYLELYAASVPKIALLFSQIRQQWLNLDEQDAQFKNLPMAEQVQKMENGLKNVEADLKAMIFSSSNPAAARTFNRLGWKQVAESVLSQGLYDYHPNRADSSGGIWCGKPYGAGFSEDLWGDPSELSALLDFDVFEAFAQDDWFEKWQPQDPHRVPAPKSGYVHAAQSHQLARFFYLLDAAQLMNPAVSFLVKKYLYRPQSNSIGRYLSTWNEGKQADYYSKIGYWGGWYSEGALVDFGANRKLIISFLSYLEDPNFDQLKRFYELFFPAWKKLRI